jgi:hypothetical protein
MSLLRSALWYVDRGIPVFPCLARDKRPRTEHGFKDATTARKQIERWWTEKPDANIGVPTGTTSGLLVIDIDPRNRGDESMERIIGSYGRWPVTAEAITGGGGRHLFFKCARGTPSGVLDQGIDLKADGGYVLVPPSIHPTGNPYRWDGFNDAEMLRRVPDPPHWVELMAGSNHAKAWMGDGCGKWRAGERNNRLTSLAGSIRRRGMSARVIEAALLVANIEHCDPLLPDAEVRGIAESVSRYETRADNSGDASGAGTLITIRASDIEPKPIHWLWPNRIARGKLNMIAGNPGRGKSQITTSIAAIVTTGNHWPVTRERCEIGSVLILSAEDDGADTIVPRLQAAEADRERVHILTAVCAGYTGEGKRRHRIFSLEQDLENLSRKLEELSDVTVLIVDPITAYLGRNTDSHKNSDVRALLAPLADLAAQHDIATILVTHLNKTIGRQALMRVTESIAFVATPRCNWLVEDDPNNQSPDKPRRRLFLPLKINIAADITGLAYRVESVTLSSAAGQIDTSRVSWESEPVTVTADEAVRSDDFRKSCGLRKIDDAKKSLKKVLAAGPVLATEVFEWAEAAGFSAATVRRAREEIGVVSEKQPEFQGRWTWALPSNMLKDTKDAQDAHLENMSIFVHDEHLCTSQEQAEIEL